jgi:small subunit ribosomal protein S16
MLSIRLKRVGTTKKPHYRVVVADSRAWRDGRFVEVLGHYDPRREPAVVKIDAERAQQWIAKGAQPSETVRSLLKQQARQQPAAPATAEAGSEAARG